MRGGYRVLGSTTLKYGGNTTCFEIQAGPHTLIIDGGMGIITWVALPKVLNLLGLHPQFEGQFDDLPGKRSLIITTSPAILGDSE